MPTNNRSHLQVSLNPQGTQSRRLAIAALGAVAVFTLSLAFSFSVRVALAEDVTPVQPAEAPAGSAPRSALPLRAQPARPLEADLICFAQIGTGETFSSTDSTAVQDAVDAAAQSDLVKVAGTCAGVQARLRSSTLYTQVVFISKTLTLQGGFTQYDWSVSDPAGHETQLDAQYNGRAILVQAGASVTVSGVTIVNGAVPLIDCGQQCYGGGIFVEASSGLLLDHSILLNNSASFGGGLANNGDLIVDHTTFNGNDVGSVGGGLYNFGNMSVTASLVTGNAAGAGGGGLGNQGMLTVTNSTIAANISDNHNDKGSGGGFQNTKVDVDSFATFVNCTFTNNQAKGNNDAGGGGIMDFGGTVNLLNTTVSGNSSLDSLSTSFGKGGGGISNYPTKPTTVTLQNSIVAANTSTVLVNKPDLAGVMKSFGDNVVGSTNGSSGVANNVKGDHAGSNTALLNPVLGPLGTDPVSLNTLPLLPGSPAIGVLTDTLCNGAPLTDQRGVKRNPPGCDAGAYQQRGFSIDLAEGGGQNTAVNSDFGTPISVTVSSWVDEPSIGGRIAFVSPATGPGAIPITTVGVIDANGVASVVLRANNLRGSYIVTATASGIEDPVTFEMTNDPLPIDLRIALQVTPTEALPGQAVTYTLVFSNAGGGTANGTRITDTILAPSALINTAFTNTGTIFVNQGGTPYQWSVGNLPAGQGGIVTITGIINPNLSGESVITNTAIIAATDVATSTGSNASTAIIGMWYSLHVAKDGNGSGNWRIYQPGGPNYPYGTNITVEPAADPGSDMTWSGNCITDGYLCSLTLTSTTTITATFFLNQYSLSVTTAGKGRGDVQATPKLDLYDYGSVVTLTVAISPASIFTGWSGDITGTLSPHPLTIYDNTTVIANFDTRRAFLPMALRP